MTSQKILRRLSEISDSGHLGNLLKGNKNSIADLFDRDAPWADIKARMDELEKAGLVKTVKQFGRVDYSITDKGMSEL